MNPRLAEALKLIDHTTWYLFQIQASGYPRPLCGAECEAHRDEGPEAMEDCTCLMCHSSYSATRDKARLTRMWDLRPNGLLAVRTGLKSNLVVLDFDLHDGGGDGAASFKRLGERGYLKDCIRSFTGGGGAHIFYAHPGAEYRVTSSQSYLAPGVDVKGENSFVVLPPSQKPGRDPYSWYIPPYERGVTPLPGPLWSGVISKSQPDREIDLLAVDFSDKATEALSQACTRLVNSTKGERNSRLFQAACRAGEAVAGGAITKNEAELLLETTLLKLFSKPDNNDRKTIRSGIKTGLTDARRGCTRDIR